MEFLLIIGLILLTGFIIGEFLSKIKLPKITGYILAGILLNPGLFHLIPSSFNEHTDIITNVALAFITFSVGGTLLIKKIKKLGKEIISITFFEVEFAFLAVFLGFLAISPFFLKYCKSHLDWCFYSNKSFISSSCITNRSISNSGCYA